MSRYGAPDLTKKAQVRGVLPLAEVVQRYSKKEQHLKQIQNTRAVLAKSPIRTLDPVQTPRIHALKRRFSNTTLDAIVAAYEAGESSLTLGERYSISCSTVLALLHERGVSVRIGKILPEDVATMAELYESGLTQQAVAEQFGITRTAVHHILCNQGVNLRRRTARCD